MAPKKKETKPKKVEKSVCGEEASAVMKRLLKTYERCCSDTNTSVSPDFKAALKAKIEEEKFIRKIIVNNDAAAIGKPESLRLEPLIESLRKTRYIYIQYLHVWTLPLLQQDVVALALMMEKGIYNLNCLDLTDCLLDHPALSRLSSSGALSTYSLTEICLDYNEFGDKGCQIICNGLEGNTSMLSLSLNFCNLTAASGSMLGHIIATTAIREVFLDGNSLGCEGLEALIVACGSQAQRETFERMEEDEKKRQEEESKKEEEEGRSIFSRPVSAAPKKKGKKKGGKKKKKKADEPPPPIGPWIHKLHVADNGIDSLEREDEEIVPLACMRTVRLLIMHSKCLEEVDLEDNLIGDFGGHELLEAMRERKETYGHPGIRLRTTHRMQAETLKALVKLGAGSIKKKKKKKKKK